MTTKQVITIAPDGSMSGLQTKPGKGVDLRQFGKAKIKRASEIIFDEGKQLWFVEIKAGKYAGTAITHEFYGTRTGNAVLYTEAEPRMMFTEYEGAVACEIATLDAIRLLEGPHVL